MNKRNLAIDMFRGLTMLLMVFVNEFWKVFNVPHWLEHFATMEDGMGLSDIVFPMFLFAMGMSIPYALERRREKGYSTESTLKHIFSRTLALLVMGAFICNQESREMTGNRGLWVLLMVVGFFLTWNQYPRDWKPARWLKLSGVILLIVLALCFRSTDGGLFQGLWWGILGQIGWMYLFCAMVWLLCRERTWIIPVIWAGLCLVNLSVIPMRDGSQLVGPNILADFANALQLGKCYGPIMGLGGVMLTVADWKLSDRPSGQADRPGDRRRGRPGHPGNGGPHRLDRLQEPRDAPLVPLRLRHFRGPVHASALHGKKGLDRLVQTPCSCGNRYPDGVYDSLSVRRPVGLCQSHHPRVADRLGGRRQMRPHGGRLYRLRLGIDQGRHQTQNLTSQ